MQKSGLHETCFCFIFRISGTVILAQNEGMSTVKNLVFVVISKDRKFIKDIKKQVGNIGVTVYNAGSAAEALKKIRTHQTSVGIIDADADEFDCQVIMQELVDSGKFRYVMSVTEKLKEDEILGKEDYDVCSCLYTPIDKRVFPLVVGHIAEVYQLNRTVLDKERKLLHFDIINEIARMTLRSRDQEKLLWDLASLIQKRLDLFNVNIFIRDEDTGRLYLEAFAGGFGDDLVVGYNLGLGEGLTGWAAEHRQVVVSGDVKNEPRRIHGFAFEDKVRSEMAVPIISEDRVLGVIHVESCDRDAFSESDVSALETISDQMSIALDNMRLSRELIYSQKLNETIIDSLPVSILILDRGFNVSYVNLTFCEINNFRREDVLGRPFGSLLSEVLPREFNLEKDLGNVINHRVSINHSNIRHTSPIHGENILNFTFTFLDAGDQPGIMVLIQDVTEFTKKNQQLSMLREISLAMQGLLDRDKLLHLILTSVTAGFAIGFNRAFLFLVSDDRKSLAGTLAVGPISQDEAYRIWYELSIHPMTFEDYLKKINRGELVVSALQKTVGDISFDLGSTHNILTETVTTGRYSHVLKAWEDPLVDEGMKKIILSSEFVTMPLIVKNEVIGVLFADNSFSGRGITQESIELLAMFAGTAAVGIENARIHEALGVKIEELEQTNIELAKAQDLLIRNERLTAIGEVSARLAHEIRNPLSTIGGFARSIPIKYNDMERTIRNARIIVEEVERLEHILTNVLDFSKPSVPKKAPTDINELAKDTVAILEGSFLSNGVVSVLTFSEEKLIADIDATQIKQVMINVIQNGLFAMPEGGALEIRTGREDNTIRIDITDTGTGIPTDYLDNIFEPFFTTRGGGTGLGLSISNIIVRNHNGYIKINTEEGKGTTVSIFLPTL